MLLPFLVLKVYRYFSSENVCWISYSFYLPWSDHFNCVVSGVILKLLIIVFSWISRYKRAFRFNIFLSILLSYILFVFLVLEVKWHEFLKGCLKFITYISNFTFYMGDNHWGVVQYLQQNDMDINRVINLVSITTSPIFLLHLLLCLPFLLIFFLFVFVFY